LLTKFFLASAAELGILPCDTFKHIPDDGAKLDYFIRPQAFNNDDAEQRRVILETSCWLRTPNLNFVSTSDTCLYYLHGWVDIVFFSSNWGNVHPMFCLPSSLSVDEMGNIVSQLSKGLSLKGSFELWKRVKHVDDTNEWSAWRRDVLDNDMATPVIIDSIYDIFSKKSDLLRIGHHFIRGSNIFDNWEIPDISLRNQNAILRINYLPKLPVSEGDRIYAQIDLLSSNLCAPESYGTFDVHFTLVNELRNDWKINTYLLASLGNSINISTNANARGVVGSMRAVNTLMELDVYRRTAQRLNVNFATSIQAGSIGFNQFTQAGTHAYSKSNLSTLLQGNAPKTDLHAPDFCVLHVKEIGNEGALIQ